ncbi:MAG TPA: hypothetical protein VLB27_07140, partial [candidate division Zixibacteria bacterium]|nr:hypothetical protein [candidate division Zixibacteria bacterium]
MTLADNILRALTSSSNEKFDGALQILDIITQLVADRLGASLCATLYRKAEDDRYRLLAIEDTVGIPTDRLPEFERFVNDNVDCEGFVGRYLDVRHDNAVNRSNVETLERAGVQILYAYQFTPGEADSALII